MADSWNKKERERNKQKKKKEKAEKMQERKELSKNGTHPDNMIAYLDENGNISDTPPDPRKKKEFKLEDIQIGVPEYVPPSAEEMIRKGKITFYNTDKGFGFIRDLASQESIFFHVNNLTEPVNENDNVTFEVEMGQRGAQAVNITLKVS